MRQNLDEIKNVLQKHSYNINSIICEVMKKFNFKTICSKIGASKDYGYSVSEIITLMVMFPLMLLQSVHALYKSEYKNLTTMKKDAIYRLKNNPKIPWRRLLYGVCKKFKELINPKGEIASNSAFVIDDTIDSRVGAKIENVSYVHDHTGKAGTKLGFKNLFLGLFDGISFMPLDFSIHSEKALPRKKRKQQFKKECAAKSNGTTRRKEYKTKKNINAIILLKRAIKNGFIAKYVLVDSWFGGKEFIKAVREIKNGAIHVICGIRKDKRNYLYDGCIMNAKQLIMKLRQAGTQKRCRKWNTRYFEVIVNYDEIGSVKLYICRFPYQKEWRIFLTTETSLSFLQMMEQYSVRWSIEVFFKEAKQHLRMGKCQSRDFDAQIASLTTICIVYIFLAYYRRINAYETLGNLFSVIKDELCEKNLAQRLWELFDELLQIVIEAIAESGTVDIKSFRQSPEYQYLQGLFEKSFLSNQLLGVNNAA
jgi:hypothetical protein